MIGWLRVQGSRAPALAGATFGHAIDPDGDVVGVIEGSGMGFTILTR